MHNLIIFKEDVERHIPNFSNLRIDLIWNGSIVPKLSELKAIEQGMVDAVRFWSAHRWDGSYSQDFLKMEVKSSLSIADDDLRVLYFCGANYLSEMEGMPIG